MNETLFSQIQKTVGATQRVRFDRGRVTITDRGGRTRLDIGGGLGGGGNFAYPFSPSLIKVGPVYEWGAWHVMDVEPRELTDLFPITMHEI